MVKVISILYLIFTVLNSCLAVEQFSYKLSDTTRINFRFNSYINAKNKATKHPLLIYLHGKGECGDDNEKQMHHIKKWLPDSLNKLSYNCYFLAPQIPVNHTWSYYKKQEQILSYADSVPLAQIVLVKVIDSLIHHLNIDINSIYLIGISMGAFGVTDMICRHPSKFAAALAICGGGSPSGLTEKIKTACWLLHGKKDTTVAPRHSINFYNKLAAMNPSLHRLTLYDNVNHAAWTKAFAERDVVSWLFSKKID